MGRWGISDGAAALLQDAPAWDMTLPWQKMIPGRSLDELQRFRAAGFDFVSLTVADDECWIQDTIAYLGELRGWIAAQPDDLTLVRTVAEVERAKAEGKLAVGLHFQGTNPFQGDLGMVQVYYDLGIRHALLAYNRKNMVGDGCHERTDSGLSRFGLKLVAEMNRVGMLVDCTHTGYRTTMDAMEASTAPCIFSHSSCRALHDHERNIRDDQIEACAKTGGVIGLTGVGLFMSREGTDISAEIVIRHIDHVVQLVGARHAGIGLDYVHDVRSMMQLIADRPETFEDPSYRVPEIAFGSPAMIPQIADGLLRRNYSEDDVRGILGGNFTRVFTEVCWS